MGSRFSSKQLVNDLNLEVEAPDGTIYLGNVFQNGRSVIGGTADDTNNVEVVLVDNAQTGLWKITVSDVQHGGPRSQMFAIAASGVGINDLRPEDSSRRFTCLPEGIVSPGLESSAGSA